MFVKKKKNRSGTVSVVVAEKISGRYSELTTVGVSSDESVIEQLVNKGKKWIDCEEERRHPRLDLFGGERKRCEQELMNAERLLSNITNIIINGADLILDRVFDNVGFNRIEDEIFRKLVKARLSYPASKSATVEYYLDKLSDSQHDIVQDISVEHTLKILGGHIGVLFYDVTTLYFEADYEDELRKIKEWILALPKNDCQMLEYDKGEGRRLLVGYTADRARKDAYNREKGIRRLEKAYRRGILTKEHINKRGYNKFLSMEGEVKVSIDYDC